MIKFGSLKKKKILKIVSNRKKKCSDPLRSLLLKASRLFIEK